MIQSYFKKQEKSQTTLSLYLKLLKKEEEQQQQKTPKVSRRGKGRNKWNRDKIMTNNENKN